MKGQNVVSRMLNMIHHEAIIKAKINAYWSKFEMLGFDRSKLEPKMKKLTKEHQTEYYYNISCFFEIARYFIIDLGEDYTFERFERHYEESQKFGISVMSYFNQIIRN